MLVICWYIVCTIGIIWTIPKIMNCQNSREGRKYATIMLFFFFLSAVPMLYIELTVG